MYVILYANSKDQMGLVMDGEAPAMFADSSSAYVFLEKAMEQPSHPRLMWIRRLPVADFG